MFIQGKLAMMFGYSYMLPDIQARAPKLNFAITKLPQIEGNSQSVNYADYWVEAVSKKSAHIPEAWDFIQFMAKADQARTYLNKTKKPAALRSLIEEQIEGQTISEFAKQVLTAKSWYKGADANAAESIMKEMIDKALTGQEQLTDIINAGASKIQQTIIRH